LMRKSALIVMTRGGVVRSLDNYGEQQLAYKMRKSQEWFNHGRFLVHSLTHLLTDINQ
jgi:ribosomal protein S6